MKKNKKKARKPRDWNAVNAHFRSSAGAMKDKDKHESKFFARKSMSEYAKQFLEEYGHLFEEEDLDEDAKKVLYDNLWDLYTEDK